MSIVPYCCNIKSTPMERDSLYDALYSYYLELNGEEVRERPEWDWCPPGGRKVGGPYNGEYVGYDGGRQGMWRVAQYKREHLGDLDDG